MPIKHLVISGGGPNILQLYGGLKYSHIKDVWCIDNIESIYATSAGSIVSLLSLLKIPFNDIDNYLINRPWDTIFNISGHSLLRLLKETGILNFSFKLPDKDHDNEVNAGLFREYTFCVTTSSNISITGTLLRSAYEFLVRSNSKLNTSPYFEKTE